MPHQSTSSSVIDAARKTAIPFWKAFATKGILAALYNNQLTRPRHNPPPDRMVGTTKPNTLAAARRGSPHSN